MSDSEGEEEARIRRGAYYDRRDNVDNQNELEMGRGRSRSRSPERFGFGHNDNRESFRNNRNQNRNYKDNYKNYYEKTNDQWHNRHASSGWSGRNRHPGSNYNGDRKYGTERFHSDMMPPFSGAAGYSRMANMAGQYQQQHSNSSFANFMPPMFPGVPLVPSLSNQGLNNHQNNFYDSAGFNMGKRSNNNYMGQSGHMQRGGRNNNNSNNFKNNSSDNKPELPDAECTLTLYKVPEELCTPVSIMKYYKRFGKILRIKCVAADERAHVMFISKQDLEAALSSVDPIMGRSFIQMRMAKYDIPPLDDKVKAGFDNDVSYFFYDLHDKDTHFSSVNANKSNSQPDPSVEREKYKWTNDSQSSVIERSSQEMSEAAAVDSKEKLVAKARQLEDLVSRRRKALELMEERKLIEEKMKRMEQDRTSLRDLAKLDELEEDLR